MNLWWRCPGCNQEDSSGCTGMKIGFFLHRVELDHKNLSPKCETPISEFIIASGRKEPAAAH